MFYWMKHLNINNFTGNMTLSIGWAIIGCTFLVTGIRIIALLKTSFPLIYDDNKTKLVMTTVFLSIPMFIRTLWDGLNSIIEL